MDPRVWGRGERRETTSHRQGEEEGDFEGQKWATNISPTEVRGLIANQKPIREKRIWGGKFLTVIFFLYWYQVGWKNSGCKSDCTYEGRGGGGIERLLERHCFGKSVK